MIVSPPTFRLRHAVTALFLIFMIWQLRQQTHAAIPPAQDVGRFMPKDPAGMTGLRKPLTDNRRHRIAAQYRLGFFNAFSNPQEKEPGPYPSLIGLPMGKAKPIPKIQRKPWGETTDEREERRNRQRTVKDAFVHAWKGYKKSAWRMDDLKPLMGGSTSTIFGWEKILIDSLDTLWIMGLTDYFYEAVMEVRKIDFTQTIESEVNVFQTTIRYLGGLLGAYDVSGGQPEYKILLDKAIELGDFLLKAFDTDNRMPMTRWKW
jgi:mannosyl-oligosaccharide alpha-1,2-mannosidase